jgi:hypothetical protein
VKSRISSVLLAGILSSFGSLPAFISNGIIGYDSQSHVAKTAFLMFSWSHGNFGGWSEFWYSGFQLFYTYSPLTYILAALFGMPLDNALFGMRVVIVLSFFLSGVGAYALARDFGIPNDWSIVAALVYSIISPHILMLFYTGTLTYSLAFAIAPILFLALRASLRSETIKSVLALGILLGLLVISNETTCYAIFFPLAAYLILSTPRAKIVKTAAIVISSLIVGFLLSAFWLLPYLELDLSGGLNLLSEASSGTYPSSFVVHWYTFFIPDYGNTNSGDLGWILLIPALCSIVFLRKMKREEVALYGASVVIVLLTFGSSLTPLFYKIPFVLALQFAWRFEIGDVLFLTPLAFLFFYRLGEYLKAKGTFLVLQKQILQRRRWRTMLMFVLLIVLVISYPLATLGFTSSESVFNSSNPDQQGALNFLASQAGFFRIMVFDRYYSNIPEFILKGSIDGWYDQATTQAYRNYTFNLYYCGANNRTLNGLRLLGVRYVMIDNGYGGDATSALNNYGATNIFGAPVYNNSAVTIYQVPNSKLLYVSSVMPNSEFSFSQNVACNEAIPTLPQDLANYSISGMIWSETRISFDVSVNQSSYVLISNAYSPSWHATDNGSATPILVSPPGLPVVKVSSGTHRIVLFYAGVPYALDSAIMSLASFAGASIILLLSNWNNDILNRVVHIRRDKSLGSQ